VLTLTDPAAQRCQRARSGSLLDTARQRPLFSTGAPALLRGGHRAQQRALASYNDKGHYARPLAALRRQYRKRQQQL
ncbi:hypothetical protein Q6324_29110, partial [Klebsiella pneumoniae]